MTADKPKFDAEKIKAEWIKTRSKGKTHFILINGVLIWGVIGTIGSYILNLGYDYFYDHADFQWLSKKLPVHFIIRFVIWSLAGCVLSWLLWNKREKEFFSENK